MSALDAHDGLLAEVSAVVLCHNRIEEVRRNIPLRVEDVRRQGLELVVVDNASSDGTAEWLTTLHAEDPCFALVLNDRNLGVGAGRNAGWERTTRAVVITHDEDAEVATEQLVALVQALDGAPHAAIVHPIPVGPTTGQPQIAILPAPHRATNFHGSCYAVRRTVIDAVGVHDPDCDFGGEELDLSIRVRAAGWDVLQVPDIRIVHRAVRRAAPVARWRHERWMQNHARVLWRWFPARQALPWSLLMLLAEARGAVRRREIAAVPALARAWAAGVRQGRALHAPVPRSVARFYAGRLGVAAALRRATGVPV